MMKTHPGSEQLQHQEQDQCCTQASPQLFSWWPHGTFKPAFRFVPRQVLKPAFPRQVPSLQVPAVDRDATPASHGDAVHDGDVGHRQLVDCQVQGVLLLQVGGLQVEYCCRDFLPFLFF